MDTLVFLKKPLGKKVQRDKSPKRKVKGIAHPIPAITGVAIHLVEPKPEISFVKLYKEGVERRSEETKQWCGRPEHQQCCSRLESSASSATSCDRDLHSDCGGGGPPGVDLLYECDYNDEPARHFGRGPVHSQDCTGAFMNYVNSQYS